MKENTKGMNAENENKFKVGDKVSCIYSAAGALDEGKTYTVRDVSDKYVFLNFPGIEGKGWCEGRFRLVESYQETFTPEQVIKAFISVYPIGWEVVNVEEVIQKTKQELEKRKNPEYLKYLELKEKFEP